MNGFDIARCLLTAHGRDGSEYALVELADRAGFATLRDGNLVQRSHFSVAELEEGVLAFVQTAGIDTVPRSTGEMAGPGDQGIKA